MSCDSPYSPLNEEEWYKENLSTSEEEEEEVESVKDIDMEVEPQSTDEIINQVLSNLIMKAEQNIINEQTQRNKDNHYVFEMLRTAVTGKYPKSHVDILTELDERYPNYHRAYSIHDEAEKKRHLFSTILKVNNDYLEVCSLEEIYRAIKEKVKTITTTNQITYAKVAETKEQEKPIHNRRDLEYTFFKLPNTTRADIIASLKAKFNVAGKALLLSVQPDTRYRCRWVVTFAKKEFKTKLIDDGIMIGDTRIKGRIERQRERRRRMRVRCYVPNLPFLCDDETIEQFFMPHRVVDVARRTDSDGIALGGTYVMIVKAEGHEIPRSMDFDDERFDVYYPGSRPRKLHIPDRVETEDSSPAEIEPQTGETSKEVPDQGEEVRQEGSSSSGLATEDDTTHLQTSVEECAVPPRPMEVTKSPLPKTLASFSIMISNYSAGIESLRRTLKRKAKDIECNIKTNKVSDGDVKVTFDSDSSRHDFVKLIVDECRESRIGESPSFVISEAPGIDRELWRDYGEVARTNRKTETKVAQAKRKLSTGGSDELGGEKIVKSSD